MPPSIGAGPSSSNSRLCVISSATLSSVSRTVPGATVNVSGTNV